MDSARHQRAGELFLSACDLPAADRAAYLDDACAGDAELRAAVDAMLAADSAPATALERPAFASDSESLASALAGAQETPEVIGRYRVLRVLGQGGMGTVYEAQQDAPRRTVALKLVRRGATDVDSLRRFEYEAEVLGWLNHPAIAHIYEAGVAQNGAPFFAMELVDGSRLDRYVQEHRLSVDATLELFIRVCEGVQHAHQKGVIHRDLKPGNVLVQADGQPKVLDFGVARASGGRPDDSTLETHAGELVGTLAYMSPEQVRGSASELDTRADVYALGVIAYELLAGKRPYETGGLALPAALQRVLEENPRALHDVAPETPLDVSTIVAKAMEKDKERRYASVADLVADVRRYLNHEPISARPPSAVYQLTRFVRRNRGTVAAISALVVILAAGVAVSSRLYLNEQDANTRLGKANEDLDGANEELRTAYDELGLKRDELESTNEELDSKYAELADALQLSEERLVLAQSRLALVVETNRHFERILRSPLPEEAGGEVLMVDVLRRAADYTRAVFADQPDQRKWLLWTLGNSFRGIHMFEDADRLLAEAYELIGSDEDVDPVRLAQIQASYAGNLVDLGRHQEGGELLVDAAEVLEEERERAAAGERREVGSALAGTRVALSHLFMELGRFDVAEREALRALEALEGAERGEDWTEAMRALGNAQMTGGRLREGTETMRAVLALLEEQGVGELLGAHLARNTLAMGLVNTGHNDEALTLMRRALAGTIAHLGEDHDYVMKQSANLGTVLRQTGRPEEAEEHYVRAVEIGARIYPADHPGNAQNLGMLGSLQLKLGKPEEGEANLRKAESILLAGDSQLNAIGLAHTRSYLGPALHGRGDYEGAIELHRWAYDAKTELFGPGTYVLLADLVGMAEGRTMLGQHAEALKWREEALAIARDVRGPGHPETVDVGVDSVESLIALARHEDALTRGRELRPLAEALWGGTWRIEALDADLGWCEVHADDRALGRERLRLAVEALAQRFDEDDERVAKRRRRLETLAEDDE